jgi:anti-sigma regulatory factor (Ser/Thr protein kinase)
MLWALIPVGGGRMDQSMPGSGRGMSGRVDTDTPVSSPDGAGFRHAMLGYRGRAEYRAEIVSFMRAGLVAGEPAFIALPGSGARELTGQLGNRDGQDAELICADMSELGRNPARVTPVLRAFADRHAGRRVRFVHQLVWPGRSAAEMCEAIRSEALINLALAGVRADVLCVYDATGLPPSVIEDAQRTHPEQLACGQRSASVRGVAPWEFPPGRDGPLPALPEGAEMLGYESDLTPVRHLVRRHAQRAGLGRERTADLVLAVSEVTANTLSHTAAGGTIGVWDDEQEVLCQAQDTGWIADRLAGRVRHSPESRGHGLLVVNQMCDLVELRTGSSGTAVRMHMRRHQG